MNEIMIMLKTLYKTIRSHLIQNKIYALISIGGLAIGIGCSLVIFKIIAYETSFDGYHANYENIYRLIIEYHDPTQGIAYQEGQVPPVGEAIRNEFPGVDAVMTFYVAKGDITQISIQNEDGYTQRYQESKGVVYAEPGIFKLFDFNFIAGTPANAIRDKGSVVIASSLAQKYFGLSELNVREAMNRLITINNKGTLKVKGIISDPPMNTDFPFKIIANYEDQPLSNPYFGGGTDWHSGHSYTNCYLLLRKDKSVADFEKQLLAFYEKYLGENGTLDQRYVLQPLSEIHSGQCNNYNNRQVPQKNMMILGLIGFLLIVIASINFVNLSVVQATKRFKEIGIRKIHGESNAQSIFMFLTESVFIAVVATIIGVFIADYLFIYLEDIIGYRLNADLLTNHVTLIYLSTLAISIGLLSGLYPAFIIARMSSNVALQQSITVNNSTVSASIRRALIIIQFTISLGLIISTLVMNKQLKYFLNKDLGFHKEAILLVPLPESNKDKLPILKEKLLRYPEIEMVSFGTRSPLADWKVNNAINHPLIEKDSYYANLKTADEDYLDLYQLRIIAGQNFSRKKNSGDVVVNRKLTRLIGFSDPQEAIGAHFEYGGNGWKFTIVGVVEDFHAQSLQKGMENVIFGNFSFVINEMAIRINPAILNGNQEIIEKVQAEWDEVFPNDLLNYRFFDEQITSFYQEEKNTTTLIQLFALIANLLGSLGLFGLISYTINQKTKEIGIRRVNGAQVSEILFLLNKEFIIYFAISFLIACPIAYYVMANWLQNFAYKTELSWWLFALAGCIALLISFLAVSGQTFKAARRNPVEALRYE